MNFILNNTELQIINYIKNIDSGFASPTQIGMNVGKKFYNGASSWACRQLKKMQDKGLVKKNNKGLYYLSEEWFKKGTYTLEPNKVKYVVRLESLPVFDEIVIEAINRKEARELAEKEIEVYADYTDMFITKIEKENK